MALRPRLTAGLPLSGKVSAASRPSACEVPRVRYGRQISVGVTLVSNRKRFGGPDREGAGGTLYAAKPPRCPSNITGRQSSDGMPGEPSLPASLRRAAPTIHGWDSGSPPPPSGGGGRA